MQSKHLVKILLSVEYYRRETQSPVGED